MSFPRRTPPGKRTDSPTSRSTNDIPDARGPWVPMGDMDILKAELMTHFGDMLAGLESRLLRWLPPGAPERRPREQQELMGLLADRFAAIEEDLRDLASLKHDMTKLHALAMGARMETLGQAAGTTEAPWSTPPTAEVPLCPPTAIPVTLEVKKLGAHERPELSPQSQTSSPSRHAEEMRDMREHMLGEAAGVALKLGRDDDAQGRSSRREKYAKARADVAIKVSVGCSTRVEKLGKQLTHQDLLKSFGGSLYFRAFSVFMIFVNVGVMAIETNGRVGNVLAVDLCLENRGPVAPPAPNATAFLVAEVLMVLWLLVELSINVYVDGGWRGHDRNWNLFDLVILILSAVQIFFESLTFGFLRLLRFGRLTTFARLMNLVKVMKVLRAVRLLHGVRKMIISMVYSIWSLAWAMSLMCFIIFIASVLFMQGIEVYYESRLEDVVNAERCMAGGSQTWDGTTGDYLKLPLTSVDALVDTPTEQVKKLYGSVADTMLTLFSAVSGGAEWALLADPVARISPAFIMLWVIFVCAMVFGVLNILTGIFCDAAMQAAQKDRFSIVESERASVAEASKILQEAFAHIDVDGSGKLTEDEFHDVLADEEVSALLAHLGLKTSEADDLFKMLDEDKSGQISIDEFIRGCLALKGGAKRIDAITLMYQNRRLGKCLGYLMDMTDDMWTDLEQLKQRASPRARAGAAGNGHGAVVQDRDVYAPVEV